MKFRTMRTWFEQFIEITTDEQKIQFKNSIEEAGFSAFNQLIQSIYNNLKLMEEKEFKQLKIWLELGRELFPDLVSVSPSWENTWRDTFKIYQIKVDLYKEIPEEERNGEWQVLFDNPFSTEEIVCNPNKTFAEATYLMAKYQLGIKKTEIVKLQKVTTVIIRKGT